MCSFFYITCISVKLFYDNELISDQCKETEENNRMGKTRDLFKKIKDAKGIFHAKMGSIKVRNGMDLKRSRRY